MSMSDRMSQHMSRNCQDICHGDPWWGSPWERVIPALAGMDWLGWSPHIKKLQGEAPNSWKRNGVPFPLFPHAFCDQMWTSLELGLHHLRWSPLNSDHRQPFELISTFNSPQMKWQILLPRYGSEIHDTPRPGPSRPNERMVSSCPWCRCFLCTWAEKCWPLAQRNPTEIPDKSVWANQFTKAICEQMRVVPTCK